MNKTQSKKINKEDEVQRHTPSKHIEEHHSVKRNTDEITQQRTAKVFGKPYVMRKKDQKRRAKFG